ncbi:MAG: tetratricopeptide repeat protein [Candidatus Omnitrophica bacterium]|nr:tetratricopeptide repeat protein [Candidatus Omnitrophota bacterium]
MKKKYIHWLVFIILLCVAFYLLPAKIAIILNNKGVIAYNENDYPAAISLYEKAIMISPKAETYFNLGCVYEKTGNDEQAILEFKKAIEQDPEYKPVYKAFADIYAAKKDYNQAEGYLKKFESLGGQDTGRESRDLKHERVVELYNQAVRFYDLQQGEKALNKLNEVISLDASNSGAYKAAADIYCKQGKYREALRYYKQGVVLGLRDADAFNSMGIICMRFEDYDTAIMYFRKALQMYAGNLHYMCNLASTLRDSGRFQEALPLYGKVVAGSPRYPNVHNDIAGIYDCMGLRKEAESEYQKECDIAAHLIKTGLADDFTLTRLAVAYNGLNKSDEAEEMLDEVIARNPEDYNAYYARGQVYRKLGKSAQSNADYRKASELAKKNAISADKQPQQEDKSGKELPEKRLPEAEADNFFIENAVIYMYNGHVVRGRVKQETDKNVVLEIKTGRTLGVITFSKSKIKQIKRIE